MVSPEASVGGILRVSASDKVCHSIFIKSLPSPQASLIRT